jgi:ABC-type Co2+ transport system permease subunit
MLLRALIVILAYALSGAGFMSMLVGTLPFLGGEYPLLAKVVPLVWVFAWVAHVRMSVAWVRNRSVSRRWPKWGTAAGLFSLASPLLLLLGGETPSTLDHLQGAFIMIGFASVFFLPSILLAVYLVRFHRQAQGEA